MTIKVVKISSIKRVVKLRKFTITISHACSIVYPWVFPKHDTLLCLWEEWGIHPPECQLPLSCSTEHPACVICIYTDQMITTIPTMAVPPGYVLRSMEPHLNGLLRQFWMDDLFLFLPERQRPVW